MSNFSVVGMSTSTDVRTASTDRHAPWTSIVVLGIATFAMVTAEMLPTAVLVPMSDELGVPAARGGLLVSIWAATVVVTGLPLVALTRRLDRRRVVVVALLVLAVSSLLTAAAPGFGAVLAARLLGAAAVGLLWATVNALVADLVPDVLLGRAVSVVLGGATLGMVLGTPAARLVADAASWRVAFVGLGVVTVVVAAVTAGVVRAPDGGATRAGHAVGKRCSVTPMVLVASLVALVLVGHYGAYTYVTVLAPTDALPGGASSVLLAFGIASALGIALAGRVRAATRAALVVATFGTGAALVAVAVAGRLPGPGLATLLLWGVASGALPALAQTEIMRRAGVERRALAGALVPVLFNGGIAVGAAGAAAVAAHGGVGAVPLPAAAVVLLAGAGLVVSRRGRPGRLGPNVRGASHHA